MGDCDVLNRFSTAQIPISALIFRSGPQMKIGTHLCESCSLKLLFSDTVIYEYVARFYDTLLLISLGLVLVRQHSFPRLGTSRFSRQCSVPLLLMEFLKERMTFGLARIQQTVRFHKEGDQVR